MWTKPRPGPRWQVQYMEGIKSKQQRVAEARRGAAASCLGVLRTRNQRDGASCIGALRERSQRDGAQVDRTGVGRLFRSAAITLFATTTQGAGGLSR